MLQISTKKKTTTKKTILNNIELTELTFYSHKTIVKSPNR